jgi:hypothetical protein
MKGAANSKTVPKLQLESGDWKMEYFFVTLCWEHIYVIWLSGHAWTKLAVHRPCSGWTWGAFSHAISTSAQLSLCRLMLKSGLLETTELRNFSECRSLVYVTLLGKNEFASTQLLLLCYTHTKRRHISAYLIKSCFQAFRRRTYTENSNHTHVFLYALLIILIFYTGCI